MTDVLIAARAVHFVSTATVTGVTIFSCLIAEGALRDAGVGHSMKVEAYRSKLKRIFWAGLALVVLSGATWLIALAANISDQPLIGAHAIEASLILLTETQFGHSWMVRLALIVLLIASALFEGRNDSRDLRGKWLPTLSAACLMGSLAWSGHAGGTPGMNGDIHLTADFLHLVAAGAWLGGLLPLSLLLALAGDRTDRSSALAAQVATLRFSMLGLVSVGTLLATGLVNTWMLAGNLSVLLGTDYGKLLLLKIALFVAMVGVAAINRLRLTPRLADGDAVRRLGRNAVIEIGLGLIILAIVGVLGVLPPAAHVSMQMHLRTPW